MSKQPTKEELAEMYRAKYGMIQIKKEDLVEILKTRYKVSTVKIMTVDIGDEYPTQIDDSNRPLDINIEVK